MGFPYIAIKMPKCLSISFLAKQLSHLIKSMIVMALSHLGLLKPPEEEADDDSPETPSSHVLLTGGRNPSIAIVSAHVLTSLIKKRLAVVEYGSLLEKRLGEHGDIDHSVCGVCLDSIEKSQEVGELINCCHVFHRECLDRWVDQSQITCPFCRSMLLPDKGSRIIG